MDWKGGRRGACLPVLHGAGEADFNAKTDADYRRSGGWPEEDGLLQFRRDHVLIHNKRHILSRMAFAPSAGAVIVLQSSNFSGEQDSSNNDKNYPSLYPKYCSGRAAFAEPSGAPAGRSALACACRARAVSRPHTGFLREDRSRMVI